jgi:DNA-binding PadR family transcriptional regulator
MSSSLSPTALVVLGMLRLGVRTGYDVKRAIDLSTRFFWGASFGQIYPELRRLAEAGLVEAEDDPRGAVKRRTYRLTPSGERALERALTGQGPLRFEFRDEGILRLFFGDVLEREHVLANLRLLREQHEQGLAYFRALEPKAREGFTEEGQVFPHLALRYGIGFLEWAVEWCRETERELSRRGRSRPSPREGKPAPRRRSARPRPGRSQADGR